MALSPLPRVVPGPYQHRQRQNRRAYERLETVQLSIQPYPYHFLHLLCRIRASNSDFAQAFPTIHLHPRHHASLGYRHDHDGPGA